MSRPFALRPLGWLKLVVSKLLPGAGVYWGVRARQMAGQHAKAGHTGVIVSCRMPVASQYGRAVAEGWERVTVTVGEGSSVEFLSMFKKQPRWVPLSPGETTIVADADAPGARMSVSFTVLDGLVALAEVVPAMRTGPRRVDDARLEVFDARGALLGRDARGS